MAKPTRALELHYPIIQFFNKRNYFMRFRSVYRLFKLINARHRPSRETMKRLKGGVFLLVVSSKWNYWTTNKKLWLVFSLEWKSLSLWPFSYLLRILDFRIRVFRFCRLLLLLFRFVDDRISRRSSCCPLLLLLRRRLWLLRKRVGSVCGWRSWIGITTIIATIDSSISTIFNIILSMSNGKSSY